MLVASLLVMVMSNARIAVNRLGVRLSAELWLCRSILSGQSYFKFETK